MISHTANFSRLVRALLTSLLVALTNGAQAIEVAPNEPSVLLATTSNADAGALWKHQQREIVQAFRSQTRDFLGKYYDFHLGLRGESPQHSTLKNLLLELKAGLNHVSPDSDTKTFVLGKLEEAHRLDNEGQLRKAVNELAFFLGGFREPSARLADRQPRMEILVEEPWRKVKSDERILACNAQQLLAALYSDSVPDNSKTGLAVYQRLLDAATVIINETLPDDEGATRAELLEIEHGTQWDPKDGSIQRHPVAVFRISKTLLDSFDPDENGEPKSKTFEFKMRQVVHTTRDERGKFAEYLVTNEMLEPVLIGGNNTRGQYGLHYYKTVLSVHPVIGNENATRVQFRVLSVPDFRGRLARSRLRQAVSIFIHIENRKMKSRTLARIEDHWPHRVSEAEPVPSSTAQAAAYAEP